MKVALSHQDEREIHARIAELGDLPPLPRAIQRLLEIVNDEVASAKELESLIKYDQALSARILRIANSAYYGFRGKVRTLSRAIIAIGFHRVRSLCLCTLLMELFSDRNLLDAVQRETLWKHSFATAKIASEMAQKRPWIEREEAYILGLLHDIGRLVIAVHFREYYKLMQDLARTRKVPLWCVEPQCGLMHTQVGRMIAIKWAFPEVFQRVMEFHHAPDESPSFRPEVYMIGLANILANAREYPGFLNDELTQSYCRELCIGEEEWNEYHERLNAIWLEVDVLWNLLG